MWLLPLSTLAKRRKLLQPAATGVRISEVEAPLPQAYLLSQPFGAALGFSCSFVHFLSHLTLYFVFPGKPHGFELTCFLFAASVYFAGSRANRAFTTCAAA